MVLTELFEETMATEASEESKAIDNASVESTVVNAEEITTSESDGVFADFIDKLYASQEKIELIQKSADKIIKNKKLSSEEKQAKYMELFNVAVLSFVRLPHELDRLCKTAKQRLWQDKERALKQIY